MCLAKRHVDYLEQSNEREFRDGKSSYETYVRFTDIVDRCRGCSLMDNGMHGDITGECRLQFLRVFVSMKRDAAAKPEQRRPQPPAPPKGAPEGEG